MIVLDHITKASVSEQHVNELTTLSCLAAGMNVLVQQVDLMERPLREQEEASNKKAFFFGHGLLSEQSEQLLTCYFHWYGISMCNFARLTAFLVGAEQGAFSRDAVQDPKYFEAIKKYCDGYLDSIPEIEPIRIWRNKVFAHFALTDPRKTDNAALLDASVMSPVSYFDGRLRVGGTVHSSRGAEIEMPSWSVTESHRALAPRFWPTVA